MCASLVVACSFGLCSPVSNDPVPVLTCRYIKGLYSDPITGMGYGQFVGYDSDWQSGVNGIEVGDGYHNYLVVGIVSCNCKGVVQAGRAIKGMALSLKTSRVYGRNPFTSFATRLYTDMVRVNRRSWDALHRVHACR